MDNANRRAGDLEAFQNEMAGMHPETVRPLPGETEAMARYKLDNTLNEFPYAAQEQDY